MRLSWKPLAVGLLLLSGCSPFRPFYHPNKNFYVDPEKLRINYEFIDYRSLNGRKLYATLFKTTLEPKGIVIHFHGNYGNISNHFLESYFLTKHGFDVIVFDYQGYGGSEGSPNPKRLSEDGLATVKLAQERNRGPKAALFIFGQSMGAAVAAVVAAKEPAVKAVVLEASYSRHRAIARDVLKRSWVMWPLYPIYPLFLSGNYDPVRYVAKISPRPILFIHGDKDTVIPSRMSEELFRAAKDPKELWIIPGAGHLTCRKSAGDTYEKKISEFFEGAMK